MSTDQKKKVLLHGSWTCLAVFIIAAVVFCCIPSQLWLIPVLVVTLIGFSGLRIWHDIGFDEKKISMTTWKKVIEESKKEAEDKE